MKARGKTKLVLDRETIVELEARALVIAVGGAAGGVTYTRYADCVQSAIGCPPR